MRKLGEQWVEEFDGQEHMVKAVEGVCERCGVSHLCNLSADCPMGWGLIAKDLGILRDGCLSSPWDSKVYPVISTISQTKDGQPTSVVVEFTLNRKTMVFGFFRTIQEAIDAWNMRA